MSRAGERTVWPVLDQREAPARVSRTSRALHALSELRRTPERAAVFVTLHSSARRCAAAPAAPRSASIPPHGRRPEKVVLRIDSPSYSTVSTIAAILAGKSLIAARARARCGWAKIRTRLT